jgi:hypothetical protein
MKVPKIKTTAKKDAHGTFVSGTTGEIIYIDAGNEDERYHSPELTRAEATEAFQRGLINDPDDATVVDEETGEFVDTSGLGVVAAEGVAEFAKVDGEASPLPSALDSRGSTAWADADRVTGGAEGYADGVRQDDDAAPAPRGRAARGKTAAAPKS